MKNTKLLAFSVLCCCLAMLLTACQESDQRTHYDGRLEAVQIQIAAKTAGTLVAFAAQEGDQVEKNQVLASVEHQKLNLQREQNLAQLAELVSQKKVIQAQEAQIKAQWQLSHHLLLKTQKLLAAGATTEQNRDDLATKVQVLAAQLAGLQAQDMALTHKNVQLQAQLAQTDLLIAEAQICAPIRGILLQKYREAGEQVAPNTPIAELADLRQMDAYIYVPLADLADLKLGQTVSLRLDGDTTTYRGQVSHIASVAEFTPKTIQTKEVKQNLVYEVKIAVPNPDLHLKIGMPVDVWLSPPLTQ